MKKCSKCSKIKPLDEFYKNKTTQDGLNCWCKSCVKVYQQEHREQAIKYHQKYRQEHREQIAKYDKKYRQKHHKEILKQQKKFCMLHQDERKKCQQNYYRTIKGHLRYIFNGAKQRCNNLECKDYKNYGERGIKIKFTSDEFVDYVINELQIDPRGLTIDRIDNNGNYEKGNIRFVTSAVNNNNRRQHKERKYE